MNTTDIIKILAVLLTIINCAIAQTPRFKPLNCGVVTIPPGYYASGSYTGNLPIYRSTTASYQKLCNTDFPGNDYGLNYGHPSRSEYYIGTIDECVQACESISETVCVGVSFRNDTNPPECYFKYAMGTPKYDPHVTSARVTTRDKCRYAAAQYGELVTSTNAEGMEVTFTVRCGENIEGRDIGDCILDEVPSLGACVDRCAEVPNGGCASVTVFSIKSDLYCCLKRGRITRLETKPRLYHDSATLFITKRGFKKPLPKPG
jgi:hypothetical protein